MPKRIFISFAIEDRSLRDFLVGQARNNVTPFEFVDMSVKQPWDNAWKTNCRIKIKGCDGVIAIVTKDTLHADGQKWEVKCAKEEGIPCRGLYGYSYDKPASLPPEFEGIRIINWTWDNITNWIDTV